MKKFAALAIFTLIFLGGARGQSPPQAPQDESSSQPQDHDKTAKKKETTKLHLVVTAGGDPKPVAHAQVDVTSKEEGESFTTTVFTNSSGEVDFTVPRGKMLIQVIAAHLPSGGALCNLKEEKDTVEIMLSDPAAVKPCNLKEEKKEVVEKKSADPTAEN